MKNAKLDSEKQAKKTTLKKTLVAYGVSLLKIKGRCFAPTQVQNIPKKHT